MNENPYVFSISTGDSSMSKQSTVGDSFCSPQSGLKRNIRRSAWPLCMYKKKQGLYYVVIIVWKKETSKMALD